MTPCARPDHTRDLIRARVGSDDCSPLEAPMTTTDDLAVIESTDDARRRGAVASPSAALAEDVLAGLTADPRTLPPKWLYDARGSELFDAITRLEEYYPTEAERSILVARAAEIVAASGSDTLVELGSGSSDKTTALLDAMDASDQGLHRYVGFDVSADALDGAAAVLSERYPDAAIDTCLGDFDHDLDQISHDGRQLVAFLGGTIGNYEPLARGSFLAQVRSILQDGDMFLLGTDLVKGTDRLVAAYDDREGVTAAFNLNLLVVLNRELGGDFDLDGWLHRAVWNDAEEWIEMHLVSTVDQQVRLDDLDLTLQFAAGEHIRSEVSAKFRPMRLDTELQAAGLKTVERWTDSAGDYAVTLAQPV
jgi:L-histidine N-alpha-methyltransferase